MKYIYLLKGANDCYKIGITGNINRRLGNLNTSNPDTISIIILRLVEDARALEVSLHEKYSHLMSKATTEWFKLSSEEALEVCLEIYRAPGYVEKPFDKEMREAIQLLLVNQSQLKDQVEEIKRFFSLKTGKRKSTFQEEYIKTPQIERRIVTLGDSKIYEKAKEVVREHNYASTSFLQRKLSIGYARAARMIDRLINEGIVSSGYPREVLVKK